MAIRKHLGEMLVDAGIITGTTLERALKRQSNTKKRLGNVLTEMGVVTEEEVRDFLAKQFQLKIIKEIAGMEVSSSVLDLIPVDMAVQKLVFPLACKGGTLALATADPLDYHTVDFISKKTGTQVMQVVATQTAIMEGIESHYLKGRDVGWHERRTILVVEDSPPVASIIRQTLEKEGYIVCLAGDGVEGVKMALELRPDLVICDSVMPRMDGFAFLRALKGNHATADLPVILLTSKATPEHEQDAFTSGFFDFVPKPVQPVRIAARVKRAFEMLGQ